MTIPADIPQDKQELYQERYNTITKSSQRLFIFAADQKMEHLNKDFFGPNLPKEINNPEHVFNIAQKSPIGCFATHLGLIARYGSDYPNIPYIAKLDGKTNLNKGEPYSQKMWSVDDALALNVSNLCGVGYTLYLGSDYERDMLTEAATIVTNAHKNGLIAILWIYPRGKSVPDEYDPDIIAGAAGMAASLGADFVKVQKPSGPAQNLQQAVRAAGNTKVIVSGGTAQEPQEFLKEVHNNIHQGTVAGGAVGRNIFQHTQPEALKLATALSALIYQDCSLEDALEMIK
jgi:fructose-bisphosphate aldolase/6-deoxy-5-ketofructose 1-phosphate synthase